MKEIPFGDMILPSFTWAFGGEEMIKALRQWIAHPAVEPLYRLARGARHVASFKSSDDQWGYCNICGQYTCFRYYELIKADSDLARSCEWDADVTQTINACNTLICSWCRSKFRVRAATDVLLKSFGDGKYRNLPQLISDLNRDINGHKILETASTDGIFSKYENQTFLTKTEYFPEIPRGKMHQGIRSEDLQALTFSDNYFDVIVSLDVFEHIANPWIAFKELLRVLKPQGTAIITTPIDSRLKHTKVRAEWQDNKLIHHSPAAYHLDPLRKDGILVFTEFGMDLVQELQKQNIHAHLKCYQTAKRKREQFVLVIKKENP